RYTQINADKKKKCHKEAARVAGAMRAASFFLFIRVYPRSSAVPMGALMREWCLAEQNHAFVREQKWEVAVLPFGATEPHNLHMPYGTDNFEVEAVGQRACEHAYRAGAKVLLLRTVPFGVNTNHLKVPGALTCSVTPT